MSPQWLLRSPSSLPTTTAAPLSPADHQRLVRHRSDDDDRDQILSQSATPSGIRTPRPDPADKRLPGIMHAFFGQVGTGSSKRPESSTACPPSNAWELDESAGDTMLERQPAVKINGALPTAPSSPEPSGRSPADVRQPSISEKLSHFTLGDARGQAGYPTPPESSASSFTTQKEANGDRRPSGKERPADSSAETARSHARRSSPTHALSLSSRRNTTGLKSLPGLVTDTSVAHATALSQPAPGESARTVRATTNSSPTKDGPATEETTPVAPDPPPKSALSLAASYLGLSKLTERAGSPPRQKSTPPQTPRALSR